MSTRTLVACLRDHVGATVTVAGWIHRRRVLKSVTFLVIRDRSGTAQAVFRETPASAASREPTAGASPGGGETAAQPRLDGSHTAARPGFVTEETGARPTLTPAPSTSATGRRTTSPAGLAEETVVRLTGRVTANPRAPHGVELADPELEVLSVPAWRAPFDLYRPEVPAALPTVLDHPAFALRHPLLRKRFEVSAASVAAFRRALDRRGFTEIHTPKIVATATESGANLFRLDYFGRPAYLAQSPQFFKQAMVGVFERVYETGPVFRAEPHDTARHLAQYTSLDAEFGFITDHRDVMALLREVVAEMADAAGPDAPSVPAEIPSLDFVAAQELLARHTDTDPRGEPDLAPAHERWLGEWAEREHGSAFLFVTGYPMAKRPFYTEPDPADPARSNSFDLLFRGVELVTGGQRRHRYADYHAVLGDAAGQYADYLDAFAHGMPPHGGFAIGLERWVARVLGVPNVRGTTLFPRDLHRLRP